MANTWFKFFSKTLLLLNFVVFSACTTTKEFYSTPEDSSRTTDPTYTQDHITSKIDFIEFDKNLSRFYVDEKSDHIAVMPLTGALLDSIGFLKAAKDDYDKYEYKKIADGYKAYLFNKVSCFYVFIKSDKSELKDYEIFIANTGDAEHKALIKSESEHDAILKILNEIFSKTYAPGTPRSVDTNSVFEQDLICGNKIDFKKPFYIKFKSRSNVIDLFYR